MIAAAAVGDACTMHTHGIGAPKFRRCCQGGKDCSRCCAWDMFMPIGIMMRTWLLRILSQQHGPAWSKRCHLKCAVAMGEVLQAHSELPYHICHTPLVNGARCAAVHRAISANHDRNAQREPAHG
jgi:hypothetical protein